MLCYADFSDNELVSLIATHDRKAFSELYKRYWSLLYMYACKFAERNDITEDIVQDVFISLWNRSEPLFIQTSLASYLYTCVRFKIFDIIDHEKVKSKYTVSLQQFINAGTYHTDQAFIEKELARNIEAGIKELPPRMCEVFLLSRQNGLSQKEIASQLNISDKTVKKQINKAIRLLRLKLDTMIFIALIFIKYFF